MLGTDGGNPLVFVLGDELHSEEKTEHIDAVIIGRIIDRGFIIHLCSPYPLFSSADSYVRYGGFSSTNRRSSHNPRCHKR